MCVSYLMKTDRLSWPTAPENRFSVWECESRSSSYRAANSLFSRRTEATAIKEAGSCGHTPSSRAKQHIGKLIMSNSGRSTNLLLGAIANQGCASPDSSWWTLLRSSTYRCICREILQIEMRGLNINVTHTHTHTKSANILAQYMGVVHL